MQLITDKTYVFDKEVDCIYGETEKQYTISELIQLLNKAKELYGDKEILIYDWCDSLAYGFSTICNGEDSIYIYS